MKIALVNGIRCEAQKGLKGNCPVCSDPVIAKCGPRRIWHWAHESGSSCDYSREPETLWHRAWKNQFPLDWQEFRDKAENGEVHIADVMTYHGWAIEFQHSHINPDERQSRDTYYHPKLVWVVDGTRRKRGRTQFLNALEEGTQVGGNRIVRIAFWDDCKLLRDWADSQAPIFFDFGENVLWWLFSMIPNGPVYVVQYPRTHFIEIHRSKKSDDFEVLVKDLSKRIANYESLRALAWELARPQPPRGVRRVKPSIRL